jgi:hypothetical protein
VAECESLQCQFSYFSQDKNKLKLGSGALEVDAIKNAINKFELNSYKKIIKITAKYSVENLCSVEDYILKDSASIRAWLYLESLKCDTRLFAFSPQFFLTNYKELGNVDQSNWLENRVYDLVIQEKKPYYLFKRPILAGMSGTTGVKDELSNVKKILIRIFTTLGIRI